MYSLLDNGAKDRYEALLLEAELERKHRRLRQAAAGTENNKASGKARPGIFKKLVARFS